jgi:hypothetical protein
MRTRIGETARLDIYYEGCFSGPAGINGWLAGTLGFLFGILVGVLPTCAVAALSPAGSVAALVVSIGVWSGFTVLCTVLFAVFCRTRRFSVQLHADRLDILTRTGVRSIPYDAIRFVDAGARFDTFSGREWRNTRVRIREADGHTTRIGIDRTRASSLLGELRYRCPAAGGIHFDDTVWLPDEPVLRSDARHRLRRVLLVRSILNLVVGSGWLAVLIVLAVSVASDHGSSIGERLGSWKDLAIALMAIPFTLLSLRRGARFYSRHRTV